MVVAGTGHRPDRLGGYADTVHRRLVTVASRWIMEQDKPLRIISGMALGWDQALAQAAFDLRIPFDAYVPFRGQEAKWPKYAVQRYKFLLDKAKEVKYISSPGYSGLKMHLRNEAMVDACNVVLALWNGKPEGGTYSCIEYAKTKDKPIINLWDRYIGQP